MGLGQIISFWVMCGSEVYCVRPLFAEILNRMRPNLVWSEIEWGPFGCSLKVKQSEAQLGQSETEAQLGAV